MKKTSREECYWVSKKDKIEELIECYDMFGYSTNSIFTDEEYQKNKKYINELMKEGVKKIKVTITMENVG